MWTIHTVDNDDSELAGDSEKGNICFCGCMVSGLSSGSTHVDFQMVNGMLHNGSDFIKGVPFIRIPMNAEEDAEIYVFVCVSGAAFPGSTVEIIALTNPASLFVAHFGASPFNTVSGPFSLVIPWYFIAREQLFGQVRYLYSL